MVVFPWLFVLISFGIVLAALLGPIMNGWVGHPHGEEFYELLFPICHQFPTRSFWIAGHPHGICTRCFGGYLGVLAAAAAWIYLGRDRVIQIPWLVSLSFGLFIFGVGDAVIKFTLGLDGPNLWRAFTGFSGGAGAVMIAFCLFHPTRLLNSKTGEQKCSN